jgi:hypothetical protein
MTKIKDFYGAAEEAAEEVEGADAERTKVRSAGQK